MNLHGIVRNAINSVNPFVPATIYRALPPVTSASGHRTGEWQPGAALRVQKQAMSQKDLEHTDNLNLQGILTKIWMDGAVYGVDRATQGGGDLILIGTELWLVGAVMEIWTDWCSVVGVLQVMPPPGFVP